MSRNPTLFLLSLFAIFCSTSLFAQLAMNLKLNGQNYIRFEKIYARLTIKNQSGQPIVFGSNKNLQCKISFEIETIKGDRPKSLETPMYQITDTLLPAGEKQTFSIPITKYFEFSSSGKYRIKAIVTHAQLPKSYETEQVEFNIVDGKVVWSTSVGVPSLSSEEGTDPKIDKRTFSIISYFDGTSKIFCLLVEDDKHIYGLTKVGYDIGTVKPQCEIDRLSNLHLLIQSSATIFSYFIYDISCRLEDKEVYKKIDEYTIPTLLKDEATGRIGVVGGIIAVEGEDYTEKKEVSTQKANDKKSN